MNKEEDITNKEEDITNKEEDIVNKEDNIVNSKENIVNKEDNISNKKEDIVIKEIVKKIKIDTKTKSYKVIISNNLFVKIGHIMLENLPASKSCKVCIISDTNVGELYAAPIEKSLLDAGYEVCKYLINPGEPSKDILNYQKIIDYMSSQSMTRQDIVLSLGGGVVGDLAGFCAASYQRGMGLVNLPTSLLAMIDSSVGGKTAINTAYGKNQIGAFYQPDLVVCDIGSLSSLDDLNWSSGMAEMIKYAVLDRSLDIEKLAGKNNKKDLIEDIYKAISIKTKYVSSDEFDRGQRQVLNLGHTMGHAIEKLSDYKLSHGQSVGIGLNLIARYAVNKGLMNFSDLITITIALNKAGLEIESPYDMDKMIDLIRADKKRQSNKIKLIIPRSIGHCQVVDTDLDDIASFNTKLIPTKDLKSGLLGEKLNHSRSKELHAQLGDYDYQLYEISRDNIDDYMKNYPLDSSNVTIPYKQILVKYCNQLSNRARSIGAVNTLVRLTNGSIYGDNTDYYGFSKMVEKLGISIKDKYVLILGSGGASLTVKAYMKDFEASRIVIISRTGEDNYNNISKHYDKADIIVNASPVGMYPNIDYSPINIRHFKKIEAVLDLIYNPDQTRLLREASQMGIKTINGMTMLREQARLASFIFKQKI